MKWYPEGMSELQQVLYSIQGLSAAEKLVLRDLLSTELARGGSKPASGGAHQLVGLLKDEPQLADAIVESAMTARETRPFRANGG